MAYAVAPGYTHDMNPPYVLDEDRSAPHRSRCVR